MNATQEMCLSSVVYFVTVMVTTSIDVLSKRKQRKKSWAFNIDKQIDIHMYIHISKLLYVDIFQHD